jgi:hypothetical protein
MSEKPRSQEQPEYNFNFPLKEKIPLGHQDTRSLYEPSRFLLDIQERGLQIVSEREDQGDHIVSLDIRPGSYEVDAGFATYDLSDKRFMYSNNPEEKQHVPLILDPENPGFTKLQLELMNDLETEGLDFFSGDGDPKKLAKLVAALASVMQHNIHSHERTENISRLSQIIEAKQSACAGEALVAGSLLKKIFSVGAGHGPYDVRRIDGASAHFEGQRPHDVGHSWLRISDGHGNVVLYDPHYKKQRIYNLADLKVEPTDPFLQYGVEAGFMAKIHNQSRSGLKSIGGVKLVQSFKGATEVWVDTREAHAAQIRGFRKLTFDTQGGSVELHNGSFSLSRKPDGQSARKLEPLVDIRKTS